MRTSAARVASLVAVSLVTVAACKKEEPPPAPGITAVSPVRGFMAGGTEVTVTGHDFKDASEVKFGEVPGTNIRVGGDGATLQVTTGASTRGTVPVTVVTKGGNAALPAAYTYISPVTVSLLDPATVKNGGTTQVVVRGSGLYAPVTVTLTQGTSTTTLTAGTGTDLAVPVDVPPLPTGNYTVVVTNADGETATVSAPLVVEAADPPEVTAVTPGRGLEQGGNQVRIQGRYFSGATAVTFGAAAATGFQVNTNGTEIVVPAPAATRGVVTVTVTTPAGSGSMDNAYTYARPVVLSGVSPPQVVSNTASSVTIQGSGFIPPVRVSVGNPPVSSVVRAVTETTIGVDLPAMEPGNYSVTVVNFDGESGSLGSPLRVRNGLALTSIHPRAGFTDETTTVEIEGDVANVTEILVGTTVCGNLSPLTTRRVQCDVPPGTAGARDVAVRRGTEAEGVLVSGFTYVDPNASGVKIVGVHPMGGRTTGGDAVEILATGLSGGTASVTLGGAVATGGSTSTRRLTVSTPAHAISGGALSERVDVVLTVGGSSDTDTGGFRYHVRPALTSLNPVAGATVGGDTVMVYGSGFSQEGSRVYFGGVPCKTVIYVAPTQVDCVIPPHAAGFVDVMVQNEFDVSTTSASAFEYVEAVRIVDMVPSPVSIAGGDIVEATGSGFAAGAGRMEITLTDTGTTMQGVEIISATVLRFRAPARSAAGVFPLKIEDTARSGQPFSSGVTTMTYVDPTQVKGGTHGPAIQRNLHVTALRKDNAARIAGAVAFVGDAWNGSAATGTTNARGMTVLAHNSLDGPVKLTVAATGYGAFTMVDVDATDVTVLLDPVQPVAPTVPQFGTISGSIIGWEYAGYPQGAQAGRIKRVAAVFTSEPGIGLPSWPPGAGNIISESGCDVTPGDGNNPLGNVFSVRAPVGSRVALIAVMWFYDSVDGVCDPDTAVPQGNPREGFLPLTAAAMGILPEVVVGAGTNPGNDIYVNVASTVNQQAELVGAPQSPAGTTMYTVDAMLELGSSGVLTFFTGLSASGTVGFVSAGPAGVFTYLPAGLASLGLIPTGVPYTGGFPPWTYRAVAGTASAVSLSGYTVPYSEVFERYVAAQREQVGGFYGFPSSLVPAAGGALGTTRRFSWTGLGRSDGVVMLDIGRALTASSAEPAWSVLMPGSATSLVLPDLAGSGVTDLLPATQYYWQLQGLKIFDEDGFEYNDHTLDTLQLQQHWQAHVISQPVLIVP
ncbi:MAG: IPT/TIG domain-containing protein [Deltaproteobacteria bacterium]|nr:IPT/TIG domain-containing protein [Deltaproteobacteria bacterium]